MVGGKTMKYLNHFIKRQIMVTAFGLLLCTFILIPILKTNAKEEYTTVISAAYPKVTYKIINDKSPELLISDDFDSVENLAKKNKCTVAINASAWNEFNELDMTKVNDKWLVSKNTAYIADPLILDKSGKLASVGYGMACTSYIDDNLDPEWVLTGYNSVIYDTNKINTDWNTKHDRSFIGQFQDGSYIIGVMENATYKELVAFAKTEFKDDIRILYNLDGGGSCGLYIDGQNVYQGRDVKTVIAF